jgi:cytochrome c oxidase cbb3-type subunit III
MRARRIAAALAVLSILVLAIGCQRMPGQPSPGDEPMPSEKVVDFDTLFAQNCAGCHGAGGQNGAAVALAEPLYLAAVDVETLRTIIATGIAGTSMPAFARRTGGALTDEQIGVLAEQMQGRWGNAAQFEGVTVPPLGSPAMPPMSGDAGRGAAAYQTFCARCHGADGTGGPSGHSVVDPAYLKLTSDYGLRVAIVVGRPDLGMPDWRADVPGRAMTPQEIEDVVAWLASHR